MPATGPAEALMPPVPAYPPVVALSVNNELMIEFAPFAFGSVLLVSDVEVVLPLPLAAAVHVARIVVPSDLIVAVSLAGRVSVVLTM